MAQGRVLEEASQSLIENGPTTAQGAGAAREGARSESKLNNNGVTRFPFLMGNLGQTLLSLLASSLIGVMIGLALVAIEDAAFILVGALRPSDATTMMRSVFSSFTLMCVYIVSFDVLMAIVIYRFPPCLELDLSRPERATLRIAMGPFSFFNVSHFGPETVQVRVDKLSSLQTFFTKIFVGSRAAEPPKYRVDIRQTTWSCNSCWNARSRFLLHDTDLFLGACRKLRIPIEGDSDVLAEMALVDAV